MIHSFVFKTNANPYSLRFCDIKDRLMKFMILISLICDINRYIHFLFVMLSLKHVDSSFVLDFRCDFPSFSHELRTYPPLIFGSLLWKVPYVWFGDLPIIER